MLYFHASQFIFIYKGQQYTIIVLLQGYDNLPFLYHNIIWKEYDHFDFSRKITLAHYIAALILTGYGKHQVANTLDALVIHKHATG